MEKTIAVTTMRKPKNNHYFMSWMASVWTV